MDTSHTALPKIRSTINICVCNSIKKSCSGCNFPRLLLSGFGNVNTLKVRLTWVIPLSSFLRLLQLILFFFFWSIQTGFCSRAIQKFVDIEITRTWISQNFFCRHPNLPTRLNFLPTHVTDSCHDNNFYKVLFFGMFGINATVLLLNLWTAQWQRKIEFTVIKNQYRCHVNFLITINDKVMKA